MKLNEVKYFSFCPNVPWKIKAGFVQNEIPLSTLSENIKNKEIRFLLNNNILNAICLLCILEQYNYYFPSNKLFCNSTKFNDLFNWQGLSKGFFDFNINNLKIPTPLFIFNNIAHIIGLQHSQITYSYDWLKYKKNYGRLILNRQIERGLIGWSARFLPQFRNYKINDKLNTLLKTNKIDNKKYAVIIPEHCNFTNELGNSLKIPDLQIKLLCKIFRQRGVYPIILSDNKIRYKTQDCFVFDPNLENIFYFIRNGSHVFAYDIELLLMANIISEAKLFCVKRADEFRLAGNNKFLNKNNKLYIKRKLEIKNIINEI